MARKVLLVSVLCAAVLAALGSYTLLPAAEGEAAADAAATEVTAPDAAAPDAAAPDTAAPDVIAPEPQVVAAGAGQFDIHIPWPSGWISQMYIDANVTNELNAFGIDYWILAPLIKAEYFTVSTTSYKWMSCTGNWVSQAMVVGESSTCDFRDTPLSNNGPEMTYYADRNQPGFKAWGEGLAAMMGMYAPVAKQVRVLQLDAGDFLYAVQVQGHFRQEPATWEYLLIPKDKNQYFTIFCHSYGMCEDELWHIQRNATLTKK